MFHWTQALWGKVGRNRHSKLPNPLFFTNKYLLQIFKALLSGGYVTEHKFVTSQNLRDPSICFCG